LNKAPDAFRTISEVADELDLPQHVLRFWESRFPHIRPMKRGGGRRYYRPEDIDLLRGIRHLLYGDGYTIRGVQRILREQGVRTVQSVGQGKMANLPAPPPDDSQDAYSEPNGVPTVLKFPSPLDTGAPDDADNKVEEHDPDEPAPPGFVLQNSTTAEARSGAVAPVPRAPGAPPQVRQASLPVAAPAPSGLAAEDLGRLNHALAELEACRRLLDKANEGGG
jgi:DNA-binding transcriptional MerR regulator